MMSNELNDGCKLLKHHKGKFIKKCVKNVVSEMLVSKRSVIDLIKRHIIIIILSVNILNLKA